MIKKLFIFILFVLIPFFPSTALAAGEFSSSYDITYDVNISGETEVIEKITLKNLTDRFYPSNFDLTIAAIQISEVSAFDNRGDLELTSKPFGGKTQISVKFNQQVAGLGKEYNFTLKFKARDFAQSFGKIWEVSIPKLSSTQDIENYKMTLFVPVLFGDPSVMSPKANKESENAGRLQFDFTKQQLIASGVSVVFGDTQTYDFKLSYNLTNKGYLPKVMQIGLPANTPYQKITLGSISPKPDNVTIDSDGNYLAIFKLDRGSSKVVEVSGLARLYINALYKDKALSSAVEEKYTGADKYWEKDSPLVREKLIEIFRGKEANSNSSKANLINSYVTSVLQFNPSSSVGYRRLGAVTALNNSSQGKCYEFSDLFIALARSAKIPVRENIGLGYRGNVGTRPECFPNSQIHIWPEYYDSSLGWVMVDPTWESTTGGANYFSKFDLNHISLIKQSRSETEIVSPASSDLSFSTQDFKPKATVDLRIVGPSEIFAGLPTKVIIRVENTGNTFFAFPRASFTSAKIELSDVSQGWSDIPPFGSVEKSVDLKTDYIWNSYEDILQFKVGDQTVERKILVKPLFAYKILSLMIGLTIFLMILSYFVLLFLHLTTVKSVASKMKKIKLKKKK